MSRFLKRFLSQILLNLLENFLGRRLMCEESGVLKGYILGSLGFLIHVNDFSDNIESTL